MIVAPEDTFKAWYSFDASQHARSLAASRFIIFRDDRTGDEWRRDSCLAIQKGAIVLDKLRAVRRFLARLPAARTHLLHARLMARLILNASGGAMENGGLCLDRNSGLPYVPGSAAKGCARRAAIDQLRQRSVDGSSAAPDELVSQLMTIALVFGWTELEWKGGKKKGAFISDFEFACGSRWLEIRRAAAVALLDSLQVRRRDHAEEPWKDLPNFAGTVNFLAAFPLEKDPGIDLDVITCHHQEYYNAEPGYETAPDTEEPVPVVFPAVSAKDSPLFTFPVLTNERGHGDLANQARSWLEEGLQTFGLGGKTAAGYGWFDCSPAVQEAGDEFLTERRQTEEREAQQKRQQEDDKRKAEAARKDAEARKAATANMTDEQKADYEVDQLSEQQLIEKLRRFGDLSDTAKAALLRALLDPNRRASVWQQVKTWSIQGNQKERRTWAPVADQIRALAKGQQKKMP
jgi:CRISPR type III-B/RAMP module RAMP protein Cmr6